jgi:hypothetical protein
MRKRNSAEGGYALLLVFVIAAMIAIAMYEAVPELMFEAQRTREQLLIDRGEQYSLAIRRFYTKTGRYPSTLEELESFQGIRFLRRRYKDPMSDSGEWRMVHTNGMMMTDSKTQKATGAVLGVSGPQTSNFGTLQGSTLGNTLQGTMPGQDTSSNTGGGGLGNPQQVPQQPAWARHLRGPGGPGAAPGGFGNGEAGNNGDQPQPEYPPDAGAANAQQQQQPGGDGQPQDAENGQPGQQQGQQQPFPGAPGFPPAPGGQPGQPPGFAQPGQPFPGMNQNNPSMGQPFPGMNPNNQQLGQPFPVSQGNQPGVNPAAQAIMNRLTNPQNAAQRAPGAFPTGGMAGSGGASPFNNGPPGTTSGPFGNAAGGNRNSPFTGGGAGGGSFIAGVASKSDGEGIKIYKDHTKYSEWEFLFDNKKLMQNGQQPQQVGAPGTQPGGAGPLQNGLGSQPGSPFGQTGGQAGQGGQGGPAGQPIAQPAQPGFPQPGGTEQPPPPTSDEGGDNNPNPEP